MIDELWLRDLRVSGPEGDIVGLLGVGAEWVVFETLKPGGERTALSFYKNLLGFHIREVSYFLTDKPGYDLDRLNRKLRRLMSAPSVDSMIGPYDRLYSKIISELAAGGPQNLMSQARKKMGWSAAEAIPFMLSTKGVKRRIDEIASLDSGDVDEREIVTVNGPSFPMTALAITLPNSSDCTAERLPLGSVSCPGCMVRWSFTERIVLFSGSTARTGSRA